MVAAVQMSRARALYVGLVAGVILVLAMML
jgi:hypothetical protein